MQALDATLFTYADGEWRAIGEITDLPMPIVVGMDVAADKDRTGVAVVIDGKMFSAAGLITSFERVLLHGTSPGRDPIGLISAFEPRQLAWQQPQRSVSKYGNPHPYLKRKKGRS